MENQPECPSLFPSSPQRSKRSEKVELEKLEKNRLLRRIVLFRRHANHEPALTNPVLNSRFPFETTEPSLLLFRQNGSIASVETLESHDPVYHKSVLPCAFVSCVSYEEGKRGVLGIKI